MSSRDVHDTPWPAETTVWATYDLHCHCGAIRYTIKLSPPLYEEHSQGKGVYPVTDCDCSHCERHGYLAVHPLAGNVTFTQGLNQRREYWTGNRKCPHWFCNVCGCSVGSDLRPLKEMMPGGQERYAINVRMLKDFDIQKLNIHKVEFMKSMPPKYNIDTSA